MKKKEKGKHKGNKQTKPKPKNEEMTEIKRNKSKHSYRKLKQNCLKVFEDTSKALLEEQV